MLDAARTRRLFVGISLDATARDACARVAQRLRDAAFAARYEDSDKLHVTLAFLGNVPAERFDAIVGAIRGAADRPAFEIRLDRLAAFPHERKPRVIYLGTREQSATFRALAIAVREPLTREGFTFLEDSVAHVTIARTKPPVRPLPQVEVAPIPVAVRALTLFESRYDKTNNTSYYEALFPCEMSQPPDFPRAPDVS